MAGLILYDRFHGTNHAERLLPTFLQLMARSATLFAGNLWLRSQRVLATYLYNLVHHILDTMCSRIWAAEPAGLRFRATA
jgi:hypothetical protein